MKKNIFISLFLVCSFSSFCQWDGNSITVNNPISNFSNYLGAQLVVTDKYGGVIVAWQENKSLYIQRKTVGGQLNWGTSSSPLLIYASPDAVHLADMVPDNHGGVYVLFHEVVNDLTAKLFVQHISSAGVQGRNTLVNPPNVLFCGDSKLCLSGENIFVVWGTENITSGTAPYHGNIFFQKLDPEGNYLLDSAGIPVSTQPGARLDLMVSADSAKGMYIAFTDTRNSYNTPSGIANLDVYAQHFDENGNKLWSATDVPINNTAVTNQNAYVDAAPPYLNRRTTTVTSPDGNWYVVYYNDVDTFQTSGYGLLEIKKINFSGNEVWTSAIPVDTFINSKNYLQIVPDNNNGLVLNWSLASAEADIFAQRITGEGSYPWGIDGIKIPPVIDQSFVLNGNNMTRTDDGNYIFTWVIDTLRADSSDLTQHLKAQKVNDAGQKLWNPSGVSVCRNDDARATFPWVMQSLDTSAIIVWKDSRGIFSALLQKDGTLKNIDNINYTVISSGNWNDPAIWSNGVVPPPGANITVSQSITVNVHIICNTLTILPPAILTVNAGVAVTVFNN